MKQREGMDCLGYLSDILFETSNGITPSYEGEVHSLRRNDSGSTKAGREEPAASLTTLPAAHPAADCQPDNSGVRLILTRNPLAGHPENRQGV
jgi:hypothetical protein